MEKLIKASALFVLGIGIPVLNAFAATATGTFNVTASVGQTCTIGTNIPDLAFGSVDPATQVTASTSFSVNCTSGTVYRLGLNNGVNYDSAAQTRNLLSGTNKIGYGLFQDITGTPWVDYNVPGYVQSVGTGAAIEYDVYGKTASVATPVAGNYSDLVTVTVFW